MKEVWKEIKDYEGYYQISDLGRVKSLGRKSLGRFIKERILITSFDGVGYFNVNLCKNGVKKTFKIHKLVAIAFLNHTPDGLNLVVNHINFNKLDNKLVNLEVITQRENTNRKHLKSSSKYVGVMWDKANKKWRSQIRKNGKVNYLGLFLNELDASKAYQNELKKIRI